MVSFPLPHYEGDAGTTNEAGEKALKQQTAYNDVESDLDKAVKAAASKASDSLPEQITSSSSKVESNAHDLGAAAAVAGGAMNAFGRAIKTYNGHVDDLNKQYADAKKAHFYVADDAGAEDGMSDLEKENAHDGAVHDADIALRQQLEERRKGYERTLDDAGDYAAGLLNKGPCDAAVLALVLSGNLPATTAAPYVSMSIGTLNNLRSTVATYKGVNKFVPNMTTLSRYLLKIHPEQLLRRIDLHNGIAMRQILLANKEQNLALAERLKNFKKGKLDAAQFAKMMRGEKIVKAATPGPLLGKYGANTRFLGSASKYAGKALAPLGFAAGAWEFGSTIANWDNLGTEDKVTGLVGGGATAVAGGLGTAAMIAGVAGVAFPPAGAAIAIGAGAVALGTLVYENREAIADFGKDVWHAAGDFVEDPVGTIDDGLDAVGEGLSDAGEKVGDFFGL